ncbi:GNAT family N-acetyltransferase [Kushneria aurantia]|uniref:GNAT family N-acetyltransferase n=1 Tax=Kushneria aurantia TaxID=504092 RepID=A0ABV6G0S8_9GAMM|nr:GNAT family N-acetyltransferase [Kushneria aurantia]
MSPAYDISPLSQYPQFIEACAAWNYGQWGVYSPWGLADSVQIFMHAAEDESVLPLTRVAHSGERLLGMASLVAQDGDARPDLGPWLASVFVHPSYRRRGIAHRLIEAIVAASEARGDTALYLFTPDQQALYRRHGWRNMGEIDHHGLVCTLMVRQPG